MGCKINKPFKLGGGMNYSFLFLIKNSHMKLTGDAIKSSSIKLLSIFC